MCIRDRYSSLSRTKKTMIPSERSPEDNIPKSIHERQIPSTVVYVYDLSINLVRNNVPPHVLRHSCWNNGARGGEKQTNKQTNNNKQTNKSSVQTVRHCPATVPNRELCAGIHRHPPRSSSGLEPSMLEPRPESEAESRPPGNPWV